MINQNYILFIDQSPVPEEIKRFFACKDMQIIQKSCLLATSNEREKPRAILVHWSIFKKQQLVIEQDYAFCTPIIVFDDTANENLCISLLESGVDDYLVKPLHPARLYARITAIHRRLLFKNQQDGQERPVLRFNNWSLYPASRQLFKNEKQEICLSVGEYELLFAFVKQAHKVLDREYLSKLTSQCNLGPFDRRIDVQISRLRQKIEVDVKKPRLIKTVRNKGYIFTPEVSQI